MILSDLTKYFYPKKEDFRQYYSNLWRTLADDYFDGREPVFFPGFVLAGADKTCIG